MNRRSGACQKKKKKKKKLEIYKGVKVYKQTVHLHLIIFGCSKWIKMSLLLLLLSLLSSSN